jgi:hypothetical protein
MIQLSPKSLHIRTLTEEGFCEACGSFDCAGRVPAEETRAILGVHICDQRRSYLVEFAREQDAIEFIRRRESYCAIYEPEECDIPRDFGRLLEVLYPTCPHGLSEDICYGPNHYATDAEIAMGY